MYDILLKDGVVVDPSQQLHRKTSVAIKDGKIAAIGDAIAADEALKTYQLAGRIVTPGLIDIHCHVSPEFSTLGLPTDEIGIGTGVTLLCDAGTSGAANFRTLKGCLDNSSPKTDLFYFLNIARSGLISFPEIGSSRDILFDKSREVIEKNRDSIKGVKFRATDAHLASVGLAGCQSAKRLADAVGLPLMLHLGETRPRKEGQDPLDDYSRAAVGMLGKGDILSHYLTWEPGGMIREDGTVCQELLDARSRGVVLDSCHGLNHFCFKVARHAIDRGLLPTVISTDMASIVEPAAQSLPVVMSKFLSLGLSLDQVVEMTTSNPARALGEEGRRGSLKPGMPADITVMDLLEGEFTFLDRKGGGFMVGNSLLDPRMVVKDGRPYPAWSAHHIPRYQSL